MSLVAAASEPLPEVLIQPGRGWASLQLREVWNYRELLFFLIWRDVKVRYKQTALGALWAILQPVMTMVVFTVFFGRLAKIGSDGLPYPIFSYAGLLPWTFFAHGISTASQGLVHSSNLIRKVYFPRLILPISQVLSGLVDFAVASTILVAMMFYYGITPTAAIVYLPLLLLLALATSLGIGMWFAALNVEYRDVRYVVPFLMNLWLFVTPVIYPWSRVAEKLAEKGIPGWIYGLNPMAGVVEGFRWALLGTGRRPDAVLIPSVIITLVLLVSGAFYFRRMERTFADLV